MNCIKQPLPYRIIKQIVYIGLVLFLMFPLYWIISTSFRADTEIMNAKLSLIPKTLTLSHYIDAFVKVNILQCFANSLWITIFTVIISVSIGIFMAYAFARRFFPGKNTLFGTVLFTQFIPMVAYIIPLYLIMSKLHMLNTYRSLVITYLGVAFPIAVVLLNNYMKDVPVELEEAASIDGCSQIGVLLKIIIPLSMPGIISSAIFIFITIWQEYLVAVSFISQESAYTVSMALTKFRGAYGTDWGGIMAGAVCISIPAVIMFLATKKLFIDNLSGSVKG